MGIFVVIVFGLGFAFSGSESSTAEEITSHKNQGSVQPDGTILVAGKYTIRSGQNGIVVTLPEFSQQPFFVLHFKEPTQVFEVQELSGADLSNEYRYALDGDWKKDDGKYTFYSGNRYIFRQCLVESTTNKESIDAQIRCGFPFHVVMENFGKDITEYITCIDLCVNQDGKNETYTFYPNDGEVYKKILTGLLHFDIQ